MLKDEHEGLDMKLLIEHQNMDHILEFEQVEMNVIKMMVRAHMDRKLLQELTQNNQRDPIEHEFMHNVQPISDEPDVSFDTIPHPDVVMEFKVHSRRLRYPSAFRIFEPLEVEWKLLIDQVSHYGYKGKADYST